MWFFQVAHLESTLSEIERLKVEAEKSRREAEEKMENITKESSEKVIESGNNKVVSDCHLNL